MILSSFASTSLKILVQSSAPRYVSILQSLTDFLLQTLLCGWENYPCCTDGELRYKIDLATCQRSDKTTSLSIRSGRMPSFVHISEIRGVPIIWHEPLQSNVTTNSSHGRSSSSHQQRVNVWLPHGAGCFLESCSQNTHTNMVALELCNSTMHNSVAATQSFCDFFTSPVPQKLTCIQMLPGFPHSCCILLTAVHLQGGDVPPLQQHLRREGKDTGS